MLFSSFILFADRSFPQNEDLHRGVFHKSIRKMHLMIVPVMHKCRIIWDAAAGTLCLKAFLQSRYDRHTKMRTQFHQNGEFSRSHHLGAGTLTIAPTPRYLGCLATNSRRNGDNEPLLCFARKEELLSINPLVIDYQSARTVRSQ
jgi:hypothetical protein